MNSDWWVVSWDTRIPGASGKVNGALRFGHFPDPPLILEATCSAVS
jgi:hypothetical protein